MYRFALLTIVLALSSVLSPAGASALGVATLVLKERVSASVDVVKLGDLVEVKTADERARRTLSEMTVGEMPGLSARTYSRAALTAVIRHSPYSALTLHWEGADRVAVERRMESYDGTLFVDAAREHLLRTVRGRDPALTRVDVRASEEIKPIRLPAGTLSIVPRAVRGAALSKRMCVWLDVQVNGKTYRQLPLWLTVNAYRPVWVAEHAIGARTRIAPADFRLEERDVTDVAGASFLPNDQAAPLRTSRPVAAGKILLTRDVEAAPAVARNQEVDVQVTSGAVRLETKAVAEQDGRIGDQISLRNPSSDERFQALVTGTGQVQVYVR